MSRARACVRVLDVLINVGGPGCIVRQPCWFSSESVRGKHVNEVMVDFYIVCVRNHETRGLTGLPDGGHV